MVESRLPGEPFWSNPDCRESLFGRIQIVWRAFLVESRLSRAFLVESRLSRETFLSTSDFLNLKPHHDSFEVSLNFYLLNRYRTPVPGLVLRSRSRPFLAGPGAPVKFEGSPSVGVTPVSLVNNLKKISHLLFLIKLFILFYYFTIWICFYNLLFS